MRKAILNIAVRGALVPQDPSDEPAKDFRIDIQDRDDRLPLDLPPGWSWARVENVAHARLGKMLDQAKNKGREYRYLRNTNVHWFSIRMEGLKTLRMEDAEAEKYLLRPGDVLICEGGHGIGRTAVWRSVEPGIAFQKALHRVRPNADLDSVFFAYCMAVYFDTGILQRHFTGVGIPHLTGDALKRLVFPCPPINEQRRIVTKIEELFTLVDDLKTGLESTERKGRELLDAVLRRVVGAA